MAKCTILLGMAVLIGVDEAGYGPNLGPLAVAATAWRVDAAGGEPPDLYKLLRKAVARSPGKSAAKSRRLAIADSKALYKAGAGVHLLERGVLTALAAMGDAAGEAACIERVSELLSRTGADPHELRRELDCHFDDEQRLPLELEAAEICRAAARLRQACAECGVELAAVRATLVYPAEFNALIERHCTKGAALSHVTLALVRSVVDEVIGAEPCGGGDGCDVVVYLDKHGGRNHYAALVQHHFPESWIEIVAESRVASRYRWQCGPQGRRRVEAVFRVGCEELLPTALASMTAKYHREIAMRAFNAFWSARLPALRPTAGYPGDARRFKAEIAAVQQELGIADDVLWRER